MVCFFGIIVGLYKGRVALFFAVFFLRPLFGEVYKAFGFILKRFEPSV